MNIRQTLKQKTKTVFKKPKSILEKGLYLILPLIGEKLYLRLFFKMKTGYSLNLKNPKTYNEKLNWLKLYYRKPELSDLVDKFEVKKIIANQIGEEYIIPTYGVWSSFEEIDFDVLPNQFVLKTTHDSGGIVICKDKDHFNYAAAKNKIESHQKMNGAYLIYREWIYKNLKPRIIAEKYMVDSEVGELRDYKVFCFNGEAKVMAIYTNRYSDSEKTQRSYFDKEFNLLPISSKKYTQTKSKISKPKNFTKMFILAEALAGNFPHVRVDFYEVNGKVYFGELTFFHGGGVIPFYPEEWDYTFGSWLTLPEEKYN